MLSATDRTSVLYEVGARQMEMRELSIYLSELESQLSLIFAASPDMILFTNRKARIIKVSQAVWRILGYQKTELIGKYIWDYIHPDDVLPTKQVGRQLIRDRIIYFNENTYFTNRWLRKDGKYAKLAWRFSLYDENEDASIGFATDVTNLAIDNPFSHGLIHRAISLTKDGVVITDMQHEDNAIIYANKAFCDMTGYTKGELIGQNCRILQSDDRNQAALMTIRHAIRMGEGCDVLLKNHKKDHTVFYNHLLITPVVENGIVSNYIGIARDVTEYIAAGLHSWDPHAPRGFAKLKG